MEEKHFPLGELMKESHPELLRIFMRLTDDEGKAHDTFSAVFVTLVRTQRRLAGAPAPPKIEQPIVE